MIDRPAPDAPIVGVLVRMFPKLSETFILEEILGLERMGLRLRLYSLDAPTDTLAHAAVARVKAPHRRLPAPRLRTTAVIARHHLRLAARRPIAYLGALVRALARGRAGVSDFLRAGCLGDQLLVDGVEQLHAHFVSTPADIAALASRAAGLPLSLSAHAKDIYLSKAGDLARRLDAARFTVTCTEANRGVLAQAAPHARIARVYHGIDLGQFHPERRRTDGAARPLVLAIGRLRAKKGFDVLIAACAALRDEGRDLECEIIGYGEARDHLSASIDAAGLGDRVALAGKLTREQIVERFARASVFVQPSRIAADGDRDGIPNVLLEAMAMGLPVVASDVSGIPELVTHEVSGLLVPPDDVRRLAAGIARCLDDRPLADRLGVAARAVVVERFDNDHNLAALVRLLESAHAQPRSLVSA